MGIIRSFIALDLSDTVLRRLDEVERQLRGQLASAPVRWTPVKNIHLTLKFLGDVSETNLSGLYAILKREAEKRPAFSLEVSGLGAFPSLSRPRVVWVGVQAPGELAALQHAIDLETARLGYPSEERPFSPHLTLGRVGRNATGDEARRIGSALGEMNTGSLGNSLVQAVHFYRSDLEPGGARYTRLYTANLALQKEVNPGDN